MKVLYETERLIVRYWEEKDYLDLYDYAKDEEITKFLTWQPYKSEEEAKERIAILLEKYKNNEIKTDYAIELKSENKVIGSIAIVRYSEKNEGLAEIGYVLGRKYQGFGYMTEALKGMFKYIFDNSIAARIQLQHDVDNPKSGNVMKRAGMMFEGVLRKAGESNYRSRADLANYSILKEEMDTIDDSINSNDKITIYTDGACSGNPGPGGWGAIIFDNDNKKEISGYSEVTTNNQMELIAAIKALELIEKPSEIELYSDSAYLINAFKEDWITKWQMNGFKTANNKDVANADLWAKLIEFNNKHNIKWIKVKGHADNEFNNRCDQLATGEIAKNR